MSPFRNLFPESYRTIVLDLFFRVFLFFSPVSRLKTARKCKCKCNRTGTVLDQKWRQKLKISQSHPSRLGQQVAAGCADIPTTASLFPTQQGYNVITAKRERHTLALGDSGFDGRKRGKKKEKKASEMRESLCAWGWKGFYRF